MRESVSKNSLSYFKIGSIKKKPVLQRYLFGLKESLKLFVHHKKHLMCFWDAIFRFVYIKKGHLVVKRHTILLGFFFR